MPGNSMKVRIKSIHNSFGLTAHKIEARKWWQLEWRYVDVSYDFSEAVAIALNHLDPIVTRITPDSFPRNRTS